MKSLSQALLATVFAAAVAAPAFAGQVYGNYGQHPYQGQYQGPSSYDNRCDTDEVVGTGLGAIVGGVIGNQFGHGSGKTAATIGGVILGGIAGNAIAKDSCKNDHADAYYYNNTYYDAFNDRDDDGHEYNWRNPYSNNYGTITPGEYYDSGYNGYDGPCREFEQRVYIDGRPQTATGVACRQGDGTWRIVSGD